MATRAQNQFKQELTNLFDRRTHWLTTSVFGARPGKPPRLTRSHIRKTIECMQELASEALADKLARRDFDKSVSRRKSWHPKRGKGRGRAAKQKAFRSWFRAEFGYGTFVYVFWNRRSCLYVGKTSHSGGRVASHFDKHWFGRVTRIDIYSASGRRALPALECLAVHRFRPVINKFKAERKKWTTQCDLCWAHRTIRDELKSIFRLR